MCLLFLWCAEIWRSWQQKDRSDSPVGWKTWSKLSKFWAWLAKSWNKLNGISVTYLSQLKMFRSERFLDLLFWFHHLRLNLLSKPVEHTFERELFHVCIVLLGLVRSLKVEDSLALRCWIPPQRTPHDIAHSKLTLHNIVRTIRSSVIDFQNFDLLDVLLSCWWLFFWWNFWFWGENTTNRAGYSVVRRMRCRSTSVWRSNALTYEPLSQMTWMALVKLTPDLFFGQTKSKWKQLAWTWAQFLKAKRTNEINEMEKQKMKKKKKKN